MRRQIYLILAVVFSLLIFSSCEQTSRSEGEAQFGKISSSLESANPLNLISEEEALAIAKKIIKPSPKRVIDVDRSICENGKYYYILHEYSVPDISSEVYNESLGYQGKFTVGWYRIDRQTKQLYQENMNSREPEWVLLE